MNQTSPAFTLCSRALGLAALAMGLLATPTPVVAYPIAERPIVIAHRGASGYLPEETMAAYHLAVQMGADFIEPDLFLTSDGVLIARHDRSLNVTTNVVAVAATDPELAAKAIGGSYYVDQLTYADIQKLNARSRGTPGYAIPPNAYYDGTESFPLVTFGEVLDYAYEVYQSTGRVIGVYPEVKTIPASFPGAAAYHRAIANAMLAALADPKYGGFFDGSLNNVFLQSFDGSIIQYLNDLTALPLVFLTGCPATPEAAAAIAVYADGVGISAGSGASNAACVARAHAAGLQVHVYTLYSVASQYDTVYGWGVDGIFGNHPDVNKGRRDAMYPIAMTGFAPPVGAPMTTATAPGAAPPVADAATAWNAIRGGGTVPLKFGVFDANTGDALTTLIAAVDRVRVFLVPSCTGAAADELPFPILATGGTSLRYDAFDGQFVFAWKAPKTGAGVCYLVTVSARDGSALNAFFRTR